MTLGLFGYGTVGESLYKLIETTPELGVTIKKVCVRYNDKKRSAPKELFTVNRDEILKDPDIDTVVELISDADAAYTIVKFAIEHGKHVVTANKKMLAAHLPELIALHKQHNVSLLYEASACGSIPIIRNLEEYYDNDKLYSIKGVVNGSTNYILTSMFEEQKSFKEALAKAQELGFAEADPSLDIEGHDAANKWCILLKHAYGIDVHPSNLTYTGIESIDEADASYATERGWVIRLVAYACALPNGKTAAFVIPAFVHKTDQLAFVRHEYNGVVMDTKFSSIQFLYGKGAGGNPTAGAVLSDISTLRYHYTYEYRKQHFSEQNSLSDDYFVQAYVRYPSSAEAPTHYFVAMNEWQNNGDTNFVKGTVHASLLPKLLQEKHYTVVLLPNAVVSSEDVKALDKVSGKIHVPTLN
jgi:homoserine dehydrogenase